VGYTFEVSEFQREMHKALAVYLERCRQSNESWRKIRIVSRGSDT
jgi:predicted HicB family RNase H-like nuclease